MSHALHLNVTEAVYERLRQHAEQTGQTPEEVALRTLEQSAAPPDDPLEPFIGSVANGTSGWPDEHDEHLGTALSREMTPNRDA